MIGEAFKRYKPKNISIGVFQKNYFKEANFASFKGSSYSSSASGNNSDVVENSKSKFWQSKNETDSYFIINFTKNVFRLSHISMLSCLTSNCVYNLEVYGSNAGDDWELACKIHESESYFKGSVNNAKCESLYSYKMVKLLQKGCSNNGNYFFHIVLSRTIW